MRAAEYALPPNVYIKKEQQKVEKPEEDPSSPLAYLEIEVSRIHFITDKSIIATQCLYKNPILSLSCEGDSGVTAKIILWNEQKDNAGTITISCNNYPTPSQPRHQVKHKNYNQRSSQKHQKRRRQQQQQQQQEQQHPRHQSTSKLRYRARSSSSLTLFLDYLLECPHTEIIASGSVVGTCSSSSRSSHSCCIYSHSHRNFSSSNGHVVVDTPFDCSPADPCLVVVPIGERRLPSSESLLRKYAANYVHTCNFEYKTKIYALYRHVESGAAFGQVQQQQQLKLADIQLRFKMLFVAKANVRTTTEPPPPIKLPAALLQDQLTVNANGNDNYSMPANKKTQQLQPGHLIAGKVNNQSVESVGATENNCCTSYTNNNSNNNTNNNNNNVRKGNKTIELMEAMKKIDVNLAALFAAAEQRKKEPSSPPTNHHHHNDLWLMEQLEKQEPRDNVVSQFQLIDSLKLDLEALTLQPEGTRRMDLVHNEVRPIFTVECQLSHELIDGLQRHDMFQIMQFESEKFHSLTQCTRFGQAAERKIRWPIGQDQMGHIDFTVWWREPGTCLNEMLGMGRLALVELYEASLLEQCKCIAIQRRGIHLASLYLKICLRTQRTEVVKCVPNVAKTTLTTTTTTTTTTNNITDDQQSASMGVNNDDNNCVNQAAQNGRQLAAGNNNNVDESPLPDSNLDIINFMAETSKVRLLRGYIYAGETRLLCPADGNRKPIEELSVQPFWQAQPLVATANVSGAFQLREQFAIVNDDKFLQCVERRELVLELRPLGGVARLPLHQFYIAYRDETITNHLCKGKLPVISFDGWAPIVQQSDSGVKFGELKCLLAIGSEVQIAQLKQQRGFDMAEKRTADLLDMLQTALNAPPAPPISAVVQPKAIIPSTSSTDHFNFTLHIVGAAGLPVNPGKKQGKRQAAASKRFPPFEPPNTYVTFQALNCHASPTYKSHEGLVYATSIVERSTTPKWRSTFQVTISADHLTNPQKLFILKVWKKATIGDDDALMPTPLEDAIIGFAAMSLNKMPYPIGWHNIVDFNGRVTGGLEAHVQPQAIQKPTSSQLPSPSTSVAAPPTQPLDDDEVFEQFERTLELPQLGQAIKRKFTELENISQRLRTRLVDVTGESLAPQFDIDAALDHWQSSSTQGNASIDDDADDLVEDFERALRTPTPTPPSSTSPSFFEEAANSQKE